MNLSDNDKKELNKIQKKLKSTVEAERKLGWTLFITSNFCKQLYKEVPITIKYLFKFNEPFNETTITYLILPLIDFSLEPTLLEEFITRLEEKHNEYYQYM